jgi:hypothetical protein
MHESGATGVCFRKRRSRAKSAAPGRLDGSRAENVVGLGATALLFSMFLPRGIWGSLEDRFGIRLLPMGYRLKSAGAPNLTGRSGELSNLRSDKAREAPAVPPDTWQSLP